MNSELETYINKMREFAEGPSPAREVKAYLQDTVGKLASGEIVLPEFAEDNHFYRQEQNTLKHVKSKVVAAGEALSIGPDGIHTVQAHGGQPCLSLHVYLGALSIVERSLFDWDTGEAIAYTIPAYDRLKRVVS